PMALLVGDVTTVSRGDVWRIVGGGAIALAVLVFFWRRLLALAVHEDLARVEGVGTLLPRLVYMLLLAVTIAAALKIVGVLLVTSLLIIPAAAARRLARTPEAMALLAALIGGVSVMGGLTAARAWDTPSGPSVVIAATVLFAVLWLIPRRRSLV
ncbi:MAG: iron chelate uptake ABC transporter family permease subunit, partial [Alphaproteobacteria bacterium]